MDVPNGYDEAPFSGSSTSTLSTPLLNCANHMSADNAHQAENSATTTETRLEQVPVDNSASASGSGTNSSSSQLLNVTYLSEDVSKEQQCDGKCIFPKVSVGIVAKRDDSVIGDEDGAALSGHRQEDPSNRFLLSVGPSHACDATVYMEHAISTATLAEKFDVHRPNPNATMLQTRMPNPNDVYTLRSSRADRYPVPMDAMDDSDVRHASNNRSQSVADKLSDKNDEMLGHFGATTLVDSVSTRNAAMSVVKDGDGPLDSLPAGCSDLRATKKKDSKFSIFCARQRMDHRSSLRASRHVTDIASALADGSEQSFSGQKRVFGTLAQLTMLDSGCKVTTVDLDRHLSMIDLGLTKAHRSCVDGDGAVSMCAALKSIRHCAHNGQLDIEEDLSERARKRTSALTMHIPFPESNIEIVVKPQPEAPHGYGNQNGDGQLSPWEVDQWVSHLTRGLAKAHSSAVDGDGASSSNMWTHWTTALSDQITLDLSMNLLAQDSTAVAYGVTPDKIRNTVQNGQMPLCVTTTSPWNQQTPDKMEVLLLLGCRCPSCGVLLPGDINDNTEPVVVCAQCGDLVTMVRTWIAKSIHPLVRAAQQQMDMQTRMDSLVVKKLSFTDVSPVKGGTSEKYGRLRAGSMIGTVVVCQCGAVQAPLTTAARQCSDCQSWLLAGSVEITVSSDLLLDPVMRQSLNIRQPTLLQLILASITLSPGQQAAQEQNNLVIQFPQYPLATVDQVTAARGSGLLMTSATPPIKFVKPLLDSLCSLTARIGTGSGDFEPLNYLAGKSASSRQERFKQQKGLVACLRQGKLLDLWEAMLSGKLILVEEEKERGGTSAMATEAISILVRSLIEAPGQFGKCRTTELHEVLTERASQGTSSVLVIDPRILEQLDEALFKLLRKFVPTSFYQGLEDKFWDLRQCRVSSLSLLILILGEDKQSEAIEAKDTRQHLDSILSTAWKQAETAAEFRRRYEENLAKYLAFSSMPRYPPGLGGQREQIEHLFTLFKKGALKTVVMNKWENLKLKALRARNPEPCLEDFWQLVLFQHAIIEAKDARELANRAPASEDKSKGKRTLDESINSIGIDARPCFQFTKSGTCKKGDNCTFAHDPALKKQKVPDTPDRPKPDGKGKGVKGKGTGRGLGKGDGKGLKGGKQLNPGKGNPGSRPGKGAIATNNGGAFDPAILHWCSRCKVEHKGQVSRWCLCAPCRFCEETGNTPVNHHVKYCTKRTAGYEFVPDKQPLTTPKLPGKGGRGGRGGKGGKGDKGAQTPTKPDKVTVGDMISRWNKTQIAAVRDTINSIDAEMAVDGNETPSAEQIAALTVRPANGTRSVTLAPEQQVVPYVPSSATSAIVAVRTHPPISQAKLLKSAIQKVKAVPGSHQVLVTLTQVEAEPLRAAPRRYPQLFRGGSLRLPDKDEESLSMLMCEHDTLDAMLVPRLPCCSETRVHETLVRQKEVSNFSIFGHKLQPSSADGVAMSELVSESASALTDESERSHSSQIQVVPLPKAAAGNTVNPYLAMMRMPLAAHNEFTVLTGGRTFHAHDYQIHDEVLGDIEPELLELNELAAVNELTLPLIDSGATNGMLPIGPNSNGSARLLSKITFHKTRFTVYGGGTSKLNILGWAWVRYVLQCEHTSELVVLVMRSFVALDPEGTHRAIYAPGAMKHFGWSFIIGTSQSTTVEGLEYTVTLPGPSTEAYMVDPSGHVFKCHTVGRGRSLHVIPEVDHNNSDIAEQIHSLTMVQITLLRDGGANLNSDGVEDPDYFNPEAFLPQVVTMHQVNSISMQPQRSLGSGTADSQTVHVPLIDPVPTMEDFGTLSPERYGEAIAELMAKVQMLHLMAASSPINVSKSDPHAAQERIHLVLNTLQEIGDDFASSKGKSVPTTVHSISQLQQSAIDAGFTKGVPALHLPEVQFGCPGILSRAGAPTFQHDRLQPATLPFLHMSPEEGHHRIQSLNIGNAEHFETKENQLLSRIETLTSGSMHPYGLVHIWIGNVGAILLSLLYSDRRAHTHIFTEEPVSELYALVNAEVWSQFTIHRTSASLISADMLSATLSRGLVHLNQVVSIHHEAGDSQLSLLSSLSNLPVSDSCLISECRQGLFTVVKAWPDFDPSLVTFTVQRDIKGRPDLTGLLEYRNELQVQQTAYLLEQTVNRGSSAEVDMLQEVCSLFLELEGDDQSDADDQHESIAQLTKKRGATQSKKPAKRRVSTAAAAPTSKQTSQSGTRKLPVMSLDLARLLHARFGHPGRNRLLAVLKLFGWLDKYNLPLSIPCVACHAAKARRRAHIGVLIKAEYPGQFIHADLFTGSQIAIDGSKYAAIFSDEKSRGKIVFPIRKKSHFAETMTLFLAKLRTLPETMVLDSGGENISKQFLKICYKYCIRPRYTTVGQHEENLTERSIQSLRDTSVTMLASAALSPAFWPFAMRYAAIIDQYVPGPEGLAPYQYWHSSLPPNLSLPVFGSTLIYRQENPELQGTHDVPGHCAKFLGLDPETNWCWVVDMSNPTQPIRRTSEQLQRTFRESGVVNNCAPNFSLHDYAAIGDTSRADFSEPVDIKNYLSTSLDLPDSNDILMYAEAQRFIRRRRRFLHRRGDLSATEIEGLISREWRRRAHNRLNIEYDPIDAGTYLDALLMDYDSDTEEPDEVKPVEDPSPMEQKKHAEEQTAQSKRSTRQRQAAHTDSSATEVQHQSTPLAEPFVPPLGTELAEGMFINTHCEVCNGKHFNKSDKQMLICDHCDKGYHRACIGQKWVSPPEDGWCCSKCMGATPKLVIEIARAHSNPKKAKGKIKFAQATVVHIGQVSKFAKVEVAFDGEKGTRSVNLCTTRWRLPGINNEEGICYINDSNDIVILKEPKSWKAIQRIEDPVIRQMWNDACKLEMEGLKNAQVYKLVDRPSGVKCIPLVWVFKIKQPKIGETIGRFKARCCLLGNIMDPSESSFSSPTPRLSSFRYALSWAAKTGAHVWSADVMQAFLLAPPAEPIYASFPPGFEDPNGKVMYLLKNLYGSTTAPFMFNNYLSNSLIIQGFTPNEFDPCLFTKMVEGSLLIVLTYVDDSIAIHQNPKVLEAFYNVCGTALGGSFKFGQLEQSLTRFLGFDIYRDEKGFILTQIPLIEKIFAAAKKHMVFGSENQTTTTPIAKDTILESSRPIDPDSLTAADKDWLRLFPYREILGAIGYVALGTRPDISYSYKTHGRWSSNFGRPQAMSLLSLVRYLYQSRDLPLVLCSTHGPIVGKSDADWNGTGAGQSTTGWMVFHGAAPISWRSTTNKATAKSTAEAEFMAMSSLAIELIYTRRLVDSLHHAAQPPMALYPRVMDARDCQELGHTPCLDDSAIEILRAQEGVALDLPPQTVMFTDSMAGKTVAEKLWTSDRMRHIKHSVFFIRSYIAMGELKLAFMRGVDLCADIMTKSFGARADSRGEQMDGFHKHRQEVLGQTHYRVQQCGHNKLKLMVVDANAIKSTRP